MGFGVSYPGAELPRSIPKLIYKLNRECGVPSDGLEWHGHNDFHKVHTNAATAWLYGCDFINTTLFGFGERTGNPPSSGGLPVRSSDLVSGPAILRWKERFSSISP
jgi:hypothetical protein